MIVDIYLNMKGERSNELYIIREIVVIKIKGKTLNFVEREKKGIIDSLVTKN